ncbi:MAG TPA: ureidoglycolate lyase [Actinomycetota bacterium]|jgi:ureidoglycolate lyase|nr:ureidoglycolate lyase [Actinomycetota bacterium]
MSVRLPIRELSADAFRPYGRVIERPDRAQDASGPGWAWWAETVVLEGDGRPWGVGYLDLEPAAPRFDWAERHMRTLETIVPVSGTCLVYVAPAEHPEEPGRLPGFERFEVFRVPPGSGVVMDAAVWHGAPLAADGPARAIVLIHEGTGREDVTMVRFEDEPVEIGDSPNGSPRNQRQED